MRIVHYLTEVRLEHGGVVRAVLDTCALLSAAGHEVTLLTWDGRDIPADWRADNPRLPTVIDVKRPALPRGLFSPAQLRAIGRVVESADILHLHGPWETGNAQLAHRRRRAGRPYIITLHGMLDDWCMAQGGPKKRLYLRLFGNRMFRHAAAVHCTASAEAQQSGRWLPPGKTVVIPYVFDLEPFRELPGPGPARQTLSPADTDEPIILFLSRLHPKKGVEVLIHAAAALRDGHARNFRVLLAGSGDEPYVAELKALAKHLGVADRVHFVGLVTGALKVSLYQAARVFVLPTHQENFGLVLPEALACRTPVITTRGVDIWPELESSGGAVIVDRTAKAMADAVAPLLDDPARCRTMGEAGRSWVFRELAPARIVAQLESLYARAMSPGQPRFAEAS